MRDFMMSEKKLKDTRYIHWIDVPEPKNLQTYFVYNFFVNDERVNDRGGYRPEYSSYSRVAASTSSRQTNQVINIVNPDGETQKNLNYKLPRYVEINFSVPNLDSLRSIAVPPYVRSQLQISKNVADYITEIANFENNASSNRDLNFILEDEVINQRISSKYSFLLNLSSKIGSEPGNIATDAFQEFKLKSIDQDAKNKNFFFINESVRLNQESFGQLRFGCMVDLKHAKKMLTTDTVKTDNATLQIREIARSLSINTDSQDQTNYFPKIKVVYEEETSESNPEEIFGASLLGFMIHKTGTTENGREILATKKFINCLNLNRSNIIKFLDDEVAYGNSYHYSVSTLLLVRGLTNDGSKFKQFYAIFGSTPTKFSTVQCIDERPPQDFNAVFHKYDYNNGGLWVEWQMPADRRQTIKYVQVFRRKTINEPFQCIAELNFDNSILKTPKREFVNPNRIKMYSNPQIRYRDEEFNRNSNFIYAVAAVDAHGYSTGYSRQVMVSFDRVKNKIRTKTVSISGAPKQYPNMYIDPSMDDDVFSRSVSQDAMKTSQSSKIKVYFDPDAVTATMQPDPTSRSSMLNLVKHKDEKAKYLLHLLNLDRQMDSTIIFEIKNFDRLNLTDLQRKLTNA